MSVNAEPQSIRNLLVDEVPFGPAGGKDMVALSESMYEGDDVMVFDISDDVKRQMKEQGIGSGREFAAILCMKEEDLNMHMLVWNKVMDKLMNEGAMPSIEIKEESQREVKTIRTPIIFFNIVGNYRFGSQQGKLVCMEKKGSSYIERDYRDAYDSFVKAFDEEWKKIGKSPIDWGSYDSHKYEI